VGRKTLSFRLRYVGGALTLALGLAVGAAGPAHASVTFAPSGIVGGGFVNAIAVDPSGSGKGTVLAGADISGIFQSMDNGLLWTPAKTGLMADIQQNVVGLAWDTSGDGTAYALVGQNGNNGELLVSADADDSDISWSVLDDQGVGMKEDSQGDQPRNTGRMIAQAGSELFVGSQNGLWECSIAAPLSMDGNDCGPVTAFGTDDILSVVTGSSGSNLYVSAATSLGGHTGVYKYPVSGGSATPLTDMGTALISATDLVPLSVGGTTYLYVADGNVTDEAGGIYVCNTTAGDETSCAQLVTDLDTDNDWARIDGTVSGSGTVTLYTVCAANPTCDGTNIEAYSGSATSGSWSSSPIDNNTSNINGGTSGTSGSPWWFPVNNSEYGLTGSGYSGGQIVVDPTDTSSIYLAGRGGVWEYGDVYGTDEWFPVPDGLSVTDDNAVAAEPYSSGNAEDAIVADSNWNAIVSDAHLQCCVAPAPTGTGVNSQPTNAGPSTTGDSAFSAAVEPLSSSNSDVFAGVGEQVGEGPADGAVVYCQTDPADPSHSCAAGYWHALANIPGDGNAVIGLAVGEPADGDVIMVIAAVADQGIYFLDGLTATKWKQASSDIGIATDTTNNEPLNDHIDIEFSDNSEYAYVWAPRTASMSGAFGLYQSIDISTHIDDWNFNSSPDGTEESLYGSSGTSPDVVRANYMAGQPGVDGGPPALYISSAAQVVQYDTDSESTTLMYLCPAVSCTSSTPISNTYGFNPGPVAVDDNGVPYLTNNACDMTTAGTCPQAADLYQGTADGSVATVAEGGAAYQQQILFPSGVAVSGDGYIYVASGTGGVAVTPP
jgi:hypothetical protein